MRRYVSFCAFLALALAGCADSNTATDEPGSAATPGASTSGPTATSSAPTELGTIIDSGFGQQGQYVWATALVRNNSDYVGQTVTVNFNALDAAGNILASESQVESFGQPRGEHVLGTQIDVGPGKTVTKVDATLNVEAAGAFSDKPFPEVPTTNYSINKDEYGGHQVSFEVTNPLTVALSSPRIGIICRDAAGAIIGGASEFPDLVPATGRVRVESSVLVSGQPASCKAVVAAPSDWDGEGIAGPTSSAEPAAPSNTAEAAFKTWLEQFAKQDWDAQYATLLSAQQKLITEAEYRKCRKSDAADIKWIKTLSTQDVGATEVPGTDLKLASTKVTVQVSFNGIKTPVDAHMFVEKGQWRWSMTSENLANCT